VAQGNDLYRQAQQRIAELQTQLLEINGLKKGTQGYATVLTQLLAAIAQAITNAPTTALHDRWLAQYNALRPGQTQSFAMVSDAEKPGVVMQQLDKVSDKVLALADDVAAGVGGAARALPKVVKSLPIIIGLLAVAAVAIALVVYRKRRAA
jgi:hypothetical protein